MQRKVMSMYLYTKNEPYRTRSSFLCCGERGIRGHRPRCARPPRTPILCHGHPVQPKMKKLPEQSSFLYLCTFPFNKLMSMCLYTKNEPYRTRSSFWLAEREGFEPPEPLSSTVFKTAAIDHSAISPRNRLQKYCFFFKYTNFLQKFLPICEKYSNFAPKIVQNVPTDTQIEDSPRDGDRSKPRIYW